MTDSNILPISHVSIQVIFSYDIHHIDLQERERETYTMTVDYDDDAKPNVNSQHVHGRSLGELSLMSRVHSMVCNYLLLCLPIVLHHPQVVQYI